MTRPELIIKTNQRLGEFLVATRLAHGKTKAELAIELGITESFLTNMEKRPAEIPASDFCRLIEHYGEIAILEVDSLLWGFE